MIKNILENRISSLCIILLFSLAAYSNIFSNDFVLDDFDFIVDWPLIRDWSNLPQFFFGYTPPSGQGGIFSPLKTLIHAMNYHAFGLNPLGYHVFSILVHSSAIIIIYHLSLYFTKNKTVAFLSTLFFGLHPVHAGVVSNMTGSVDVVGIVFLFISFYYYVRAGEHASKIVGKHYIISLVTALIAIFTHELCLSLPLLVFWYSFMYERQQWKWNQIIRRILPFFGIALFYVLCKFLTLKAITRGAYMYDSFYLTMLVTVKAWAKYVIISFFPIVLTHNHVIVDGIFSFEPGDFDKFTVLSQSLFEIKTFLSALFLGIIGYVAWKYRKKQTLITFGIGWFFICLLPGANIIPGGVYFAERYLYPGSWAFCLLLAVCLCKLWEYGTVYEKKLVRYLTIGGIIAITVGYSVRTWMRGADLRNQIILHETAVKANPQSALLKSDLGLVYTRYGMPQKAAASFHESIKIKPEDPSTHFALSEAYIQMKDYQKAVDALKQAIFLDEEFADAYYNLAGLYSMIGQQKESDEFLKKSLYYFRKQGRVEEAIKYENVFKGYFSRIKNQ